MLVIVAIVISPKSCLFAAQMQVYKLRSVTILPSSLFLSLSLSLSLSYAHTHTHSLSTLGLNPYSSEKVILIENALPCLAQDGLTALQRAQQKEHSDIVDLLTTEFGVTD